MRSTYFKLSSFLAALALAGGCERSQTALGPDLRVTSVSVTPRIDTISIGDTVQLAATVVMSGGKAPRAATWSTSDGAVVSVTATGLAHGLAAGSALVVASSGGKADTARFTVRPLSFPPPPVASVSVAPDSAGLAAGSTLQLVATARDSSGTPIPGAAIAWSTSNGAVASVGSKGLVTGVTAGVAGITASSGLYRATATITVTASAAGAWPNEPAGFTTVSDEPFNALAEGGWNAVQRQNTNGSGLTVGLDAAAPLSPSNVLQFKYASGFVAGSEPGAEYLDPATPIKETYFAFWWKPSNPWQNNTGSGVNKLAFLFPSASGDIYLMMYGGGPAYTIAAEPEFSGDTRLLTPNVTATPVSLGVWHRVEWYVKYSTSGTSRDGVTKWWLDGVLQGSYGDLQTPADAGFIEYQLAPTWGGVDGTKTETDFYWFDHAHVSKR